MAPPERRDISPATGWTRAHWEWAADLLLSGVRPFASPKGALYRLPGRPSSNGPEADGLEGFARTFQLAAFRIAGGGGPPHGDLAERYAAGLAAGTSPGGPDEWPAIARRSQSIVEAASIAVGLFEARAAIWGELATETKERLAAWLGAVRGELCYPNNWRVFPVVAHAFLKSVGAPHSQHEIDDGLAFIEGLHRGHGWYADGREGPCDHYSAWSFNFYLGAWARMDGDDSEPGVARRYRERLREFLDDYRHLFGADGAPLFRGRSLTYRFAAAAPFWTGALLEATPLAPGATRRLASGAVRYFLDRGAVEDGLLSGGWHGGFPPMLQAYSGPGSPYEACKAFLGLVLPPEHPVWTAPEEPLPVETADFARGLPGVRAWGTRRDGIVRVAGERKNAYPQSGAAADPHYGKLAYSTHTGPSTPDGPDCELRLLGVGRASARELRRPPRYWRARRSARITCGPASRARFATAGSPWLPPSPRNCARSRAAASSPHPMG